MSDLAAGIPIGMSIGMGAGIGVGMGIGANKTRKEIEAKLQELGSSHDVKIKKTDGNYMSMDELFQFISAESITKSTPNNSKGIIITIIAALVLIMGIFMFILLY